MAFNIMDLFAAPARNMLLQPQQSAQGVPNMLLTRPSPQNYPIAPVPSAPQIDPQTVAAVQGPSAPIAAPAAGPQVAQAQPFFNDDRKAYLNDLFTGWAAGSTPSESLAFGAKLVSANSQNRKGRNDTIDWLKSKGVDDATAKQLASSPPALNEYLKNMYEKAKPIEVGGRLVDPNTFQVIADFSDPNSKLTSDQREFQQAKADGFTGNFMDYQIKMKEAGRQQVNIDTGEKLPQGFRWKDPNKRELGVEPIPGGPATQIPGELAARVGMSESFQGDAPGLRERLQSGDMTGPVDTTLAQFGIGDRGQTYRQIQSGVDALTRLLTGAGMNNAEAKAYAERYLPGYRDTPESAVQKLDQLSKELESAKSMAMRGRGGDLGDGQNAGDIDALLKKYGAQ